MTTGEQHTRARIARLASECACITLRRTARALTNYCDDVLKERTGLRITQVPLLVAPYLAGSLSINELAEQLDLDRTTVARNLKPLEAGGLLAISPGADQRTRTVSLTADGRRRLLEVLPLWEKAQAALTAGVDMRALRSSLSSLTANA